MTEVDMLLREALAEQQREFNELEAQLSSLPQIQDERDKAHAMVARMRYNLNLPPLGSVELLEYGPGVESNDNPLLRKTLAVLEAKLADLNKQLADLQAAKDRRDNVRALILLMKENMPADQPRDIEIEVGDSLADAVVQQPLWVMVRTILLSARSSLNLATITDTLRGLGYPNVTAETVRSAIARKPDVFQRRGEGFVVIEQGNLSDLLRAVLSANPGRPMALPEIEKVIEAMGVRFKEPENASKRINVTLRRLGSKQDSGVTVIYGSENHLNGGPPITHGPMQFVWNDSFPKPSPDLPFPSEM
jgi:hypothetical protein